MSKVGGDLTQDEVVAMLKERGVELHIGGCGCCSSPAVAVVIDGKCRVETYDEQWGLGYDTETL